SRSRTSYWRLRARRAALMALTSVLSRTGRSRMVALPGTRLSIAHSLLSPPRVKTISGRSDHGGCSRRISSRRTVTSGWSASSARITAPAPAAISPKNSSAPAQARLGTSIEARSWQARVPSRPVGASTRTRCSRISRSGKAALPVEAALAQQRLGVAVVLQPPGEHALELLDLPPDPQAFGVEAQLAHA